MTRQDDAIRYFGETLPNEIGAGDVLAVLNDIGENEFHAYANGWNDCLAAASTAAGGVKEALAADIVWRISNVHDLRDPAIRDPIERAVRNALATLSLPAGGVAVSDAMRDVAAERRRQVEAEGWTPEHDDQHDKGEMARAGGLYALIAGSGPTEYRNALDGSHMLDPLEAAMRYWPWQRSWFKPTSRRRDLVKAGALILAEIERLDRLEAALSPEAKTGERS